MDVVSLLDEARRDGIDVRLDGDELKVTGKASAQHWRDRLQAHKAAVIAHLQGAPASETIPPNLPRYQPFPILALPTPAREFTAAAAGAIGCDPSFVALPLLASLARAIGNRRMIRLKATWKEPAIIWAAIIGKSGTHKTPSLQAAMQFIQRRETEAFAAHAESLARYEQDRACYERDLGDWKRLKKITEPAPWAPPEPTCNRYVTSDTTIEALAAILAAQFDGLLVCRDELAGWLNGIAEYKGGKGSDLGHWLAAWSGAPSTWDRKTGPVKMLHVPRVSVSLVGGIQPDILRNAIGREHRQDGLCARLLLAMPDPKPVRWTEATVFPATEAAMSAIFGRLLLMESALSPEGRPEPFIMGMTPEAKAVWVEYYNRHRKESEDLGEDLAAAWSKLEAYTARFALIFQLCSWAAGQASDEAVDEAAVTNAIELSDWFGSEAKRVYALFNETEEDRRQRELIDLIRRKGGRITARQLAHAGRYYRGSGDAQAALDGLARLAIGTWEYEVTGGRPTHVFTLHECNSGHGNESPQSSENSILPLPLPPFPDVNGAGLLQES